jgi:translation initiation factor IF-1
VALIVGPAPIIVVAEHMRARAARPATGPATRPSLARRDCHGSASSMAKQDTFQMDGVVTEVLPDRNYRVKLENGHLVLAYAAGRMSKFNIRVLEGDRVTLDISPYDLSRGRITYRHK